MGPARYAVDPDITVASTLPGSFYSDAQAFAASRERVFARTWQWIGDLTDVAEPGSLSPRELLPGLLDEPLLLARDAVGALRCLSNVCTHRGNILVKAPCRAKQIRCGYHSRRFDLAGRMTFMPEFAQAKDFPSASDHLPVVPFGEWQGHGFASLAPVAPLAAFLGDMEAGVASMGLGPMRFDPRAQPRLRGGRALGALRRELPRGLPHSLRARRAEPGRRLRRPTRPKSSATPTCSSHSGATARARRSTGGSSPT